MLFAVVVGTLVGLAALLGVVAVVLIPAALLARFCQRVETAEPVAVRRATREVAVPGAWSQAQPGV
ncbi:MAG TPA: hypothetical protein VN962_25570 [Polyangia bacterium]|nr:hypothetical protein [Polyangia bacterium]